jgi:hypothetical protein
MNTAIRGSGNWVQQGIFPGWPDSARSPASHEAGLLGHYYQLKASVGGEPPTGVKLVVGRVT